MTVGAIESPLTRAAAVIATGVVLGAAYTLSPLTVLALSALVPICYWASRDLSFNERRWLFGLLLVATVIRLGAVAGLFLSADSSQPHASFFGDEEFFKHRTIWMRNIGLDVPIAPADFIYSFSEVGDTQYIDIMAFVQAVVGESPYGLHVMNIMFYVAAVLALYHLARRSYGPEVATGGLVTMLLLPSLFVWSISALKEPLYTLVSVAELLCAVHIVRAEKWRHRLLAVAGVVLGAVLLQSLRKGGVILVTAGALGGIVAALVVTRPRLLLASVVLVPAMAMAGWFTPAVHDRVIEGLRQGALYHTGHIMTPGQTYELLPQHYYADRMKTLAMPANELMLFAVKAIAGYFIVPLPWHIGSTAMLAYLPEQMVWYALVAFVPLGFIAGLRRDPLVTSLLASHAVMAILLVALTSGNVGTLIRHRGLALPYLVSLSGMGVYAFVRGRTALAGDPGRTRLNGAG